jgi:hypothetical protein
MAAVVVAATCLGSGEAQAQDRLFRGLFRASSDPAASRDRLDLIATADFGFDSARFDSTLAGELEHPVTLNGTSPGGSGAVLYSHRGNRIGFAAAGGGYYRSYSVLPGQSFPSFYQLTRLSVKVSPRTELLFHQGMTHARFYGYNRAIDLDPDPDTLIPADNEGLIPPENEFFVERRSNFVHSGGAEVRYRFSERSVLSTSVSARYVDFRDQSPDMTSGRAAIRFNRRMTPYSTFRLGYAFSTWRYPAFDVRLSSHDINIGIAYARPLPASRRTRVGFDLSSAMVDAPEAMHFRVNGVAFLSHLISRDWLVAALYRRDTEVVEGFALPFFLFSDTVGATLSGNVFRRVAVTAGGGYSFGHYNVGPLKNRTEWLNGSVTARAVIYRTLAGYVHAGVGQYDFDRRLGLYQSTPLSSSRYWIRAGVVFGLPLIT